MDSYFGDKNLLALVLLVKDEINKLRIELGLTPYTNEQVKTTYKNKLNMLGKIYEEG